MEPFRNDVTEGFNFLPLLGYDLKFIANMVIKGPSWINTSVDPPGLASHFYYDSVALK